MDVWFCEAGTTAERHTCELRNLKFGFARSSYARVRSIVFSLDTRLTWKSPMRRSAGPIGNGKSRRVRQLNRHSVCHGTTKIQLYSHIRTPVSEYSYIACRSPQKALGTAYQRRLFIGLQSWRG